MNAFVFQVWQAIERVLLEDSVLCGGSGQADTADTPQFTELAPVPQLHIPEESGGGQCGSSDAGQFCHNTQQLQQNCKVTPTHSPSNIYCFVLREPIIALQNF